MAGANVPNRDWNKATDIVGVVNQLIDDLELLRARVDALAGKLDADAGVTDTNYQAGAYSSTSRVQAAQLLAGKIVTVPSAS